MLPDVGFCQLYVWIPVWRLYEVLWILCQWFVSVLTFDTARILFGMRLLVGAT